MPAPSVAPRPAAALVLARETGDGGFAVFMVRRHGQSPFMPDVFVFPGGTVQAADREAERTPGLCVPVDDPATPLGSGFRVAALRECFEEAGVLLADRAGAPLALAPDEIPQFAAYRAALYAGDMDLAALAAREGLTLATGALLHWAHWITPEGAPRRFDTHFFLAAMPDAQEATHDQLETTEGIWITPEEALARRQADSLPLAMPTVHQLQALTGLTSVAVAWERFARDPVRTTLPTMGTAGDEPIPRLPDDV